MGIIIFAVAATFLWNFYSLKLGQERVARLAEEFEKAAQEDYERALADTYGGKTPQETLQLYINAVEKGDYDLASKYFVLDKQEAELQSFKSVEDITQEQIKGYISELQRALDSGGQYSSDGTYFSFGGEVLISVVRYPNGIWKILEI